MQGLAGGSSLRDVGDLVRASPPISSGTQGVWETEGKTWRLLHGSLPILYTKPETRIFLTCINSDVTEGMLLAKLRKYGEVQIHVFTPMPNNLSWAWVGFTEGDAVLKLLEEDEDLKVMGKKPSTFKPRAGSVLNAEEMQQECSVAKGEELFAGAAAAAKSVNPAEGESGIMREENQHPKAKPASVGLAPLRVEALETDAEKDPLTFETRASARDPLPQ